MNSEKLSVRDIFCQALDIEEAEQRLAFLDQACSGDNEARRKVEDLLAANADAGRFMNDTGMSQTTIVGTVAEAPGDSIGPYKLVQQIGAGGMGVVYMAEQTDPVRRKVALKIIKPGMDTREVIARFEAERQALAMMDHPNIARVLDAGTTDPVLSSGGSGIAGESGGRPYFVMELVEGIPITEFCDEQELSTHERLELFVQVCRAVQHAHTKGVIHRDIKPSNVLVTLSDGRALPKVIDFGVAKALNQPLTDKTVYTAYGQMVGTPLYMSPEQAQLGTHDVDTRSDIYSLGVLLYELLTGNTPFDKQTLKSAGFDEMRRIIREQDPPRPSALVSTLKAEALSTVSDHRRIDPKKLSHSLRGELDWIVMKALEKDRNRRYETASALAADVQRYLHDEPVRARPPSTAYRLRKFARRNSAALITVALVVFSLLAGTGISIWQAVRATEAEQLAQGRLEEIGEQQRQTEAQQQRAESNLQLALETLEQLYLPLAEDELSEKIELSERNRQFLEQALPFYEQLAAQKADDPKMRYVAAHAHLRVGNIYRNLRTHPDEKVEPAEASLRQAIALFQQLADEVPGNLTYQQKLAHSHRSLGMLLPRHRPDARQAFRTAIELYAPVVSATDSAELYAARGACYRELQHYDDAVADFRKAVELEPKNASLHQSLCHLYTDVRVRDLGLAVIHAQKAVELEPANPWYWSELAYVYRRRRNLEAAREACVRALGLDANLSTTNLEMAEILLLEGDFEQALVFAQKGFQGYEPEPAAYQTRGMVYSQLGRFPEALADFNKTVELVPRDAWVYRGRAQIYVKLSRFEEALADYTKAIEQAPENAILLNNTAWDMVRDPGWEPQMAARAITWVQRALELNPEGTAQWNTLGVALYRAGEYAEAIDSLQKAETLNPDTYFAYNAFFIAMARWHLGDIDEARGWHEKAMAWTEKNLPDNKVLLRFQAEAEELMGIEKQKQRKSQVSSQG